MPHHVLRQTLQAVVLVALTAGPAAAEEVLFVYRDQTSIARLSDDALQRRIGRDVAECRYDVERTIASAGSVVVPESQGMVTGGRYGALLEAMTATPAQIVPAVPSDRQWRLFESCLGARGVVVTGRTGFAAMRADLKKRKPALTPRAVAFDMSVAD